MTMRKSGADALAMASFEKFNRWRESVPEYLWKGLAQKRLLHGNFSDSRFYSYPGFRRRKGSIGRCTHPFEDFIQGV